MEHFYQSVFHSPQKVATDEILFDFEVLESYENGSYERVNFPLTCSIRPDAPILAPSIWRKSVGAPIIDLSIPPGFLFGGCSESKNNF